MEFAEAVVKISAGNHGTVSWCKLLSSVYRSREKAFEKHAVYWGWQVFVLMYVRTEAGYVLMYILSLSLFVSVTHFAQIDKRNFCPVVK